MSTDTNNHATENSFPAQVLGRVSEAIIELDPDWAFTFINQQAADLFDREAETLLGNSIWETFPEATEMAAFDEFQDAMETGESTRFDMHYEPTDAWFTVRAYPGSEGLTVCFDDITREREVQRELEREQRLFEAVFEDTEDALVIADTDRRITDFNPAAERLFGYDEAEILGRKSAILYADEVDYTQKGEERFNEQAGERHDEYVVEYERADGTTFEGETVGTPLEGEDGETFAFLGAIRDVSARAKYERLIEARNEGLRTFHDITTDRTRTFEERLTAVLELGRDHLDLDAGILADIEGTDYTVETVVAPDDAVEPGARFALGETFCDIVVDRNAVVSFASASAGDFDQHPAYREQGVESYLGAPVVVDGEPYGTLNFSSSTPRGTPFTEAEENFVRLIAQWVGKELSRRKSERLARANRDRLRQIIDMLPQLVFAKDESGEFLLANESVAEAYGTTVDDLEGATDIDFADSKEEAKQFRDDDRAVIESDEPKHIPEEPLTMADGEQRIFETRKIPYDPVETDGRAVLGVATDITERKERERELQTKTTQLEAILENTNAPMFLKDADGEYVLANRQYRAVFGFEEGEVVGRTDEELHPESMSEEVRENDKMVLERGESTEVEEHIQTPDGERIYLTTKSPIYGLNETTADETPDAVFGVANDITERTERERELERQSAAMEASMDGISILDADGEYVYMNQAHADVFDYDPNDLLGSTWRRLYDEDETERIEQEIFPELEREGEWRGETVGTTSDGNEVHQEITLSLLGDGGLICTNRDITEQKERTRELERYREVVKASGDAMYALDPDGIITMVNDAHVEYAGYPEDELVGSHVSRFMPEEDVQTGSELISDILSDSDRSRGRFEMRGVRPDGTVQEYENNVAVLTTGDGEFAGSVGVIRDITDRKERERELERQRTRLRALFDESPDGIVIHDSTGAVLDVNDTQSKLLGYDIDELRSMNVAEFEVGISRSELHDLWDDMAEGEILKVEGNHRKQNGATFPVEVWVNKVAVGGEDRYIAVSRDITERKQREDRLRKFEQMVEHAGHAFFFTDVDGKIQYVNPAFEELTGYSEADAIGQTPDLLNSGEHDEEFFAQLWETVLEGDVWTGEIVNERKTGETFVSSHIVAPVKDEDGAVTNFVAAYEDITQRKERERELRESKEALREVTAIGSDTDLDYEAKLEEILELGCDRLGLPYGFLNRIDNETQHVVEATGTHPLLQPGESAPLSNAYCRRTIEREEVLDVHDAVDQGWGDDPAYEEFGLGCYIGGKVIVDGEVYGTLCFADTECRSHSFDETERAFVELLVQWISYELKGDKVERKLRQLNETAQRSMTTAATDELASLVTESAASVLDLPITGVWWYDEQLDALVPGTMTDEAVGLIGEQPTFEGGDSLAWQAFEEGKIRAYNDLQAAGGRHNEDTELLAEIIVPLADHGVLVSGSTQAHEFSETDRSLLEVLAATVEEALARVDREQDLRETRERLEQSNQELEQFAYAASHDLQEPLRTVSSYLTLLERRYRDDLDEDAVEFIEIAVDGADRMREMIQALLEYSRVETRSGAFEPTEMGDVFEQVARNLEVTIEESGATVDYPESPEAVVGDESQLVQLFQNLVENGIKYSEGDPSVDISVQRRDGAVEYAVSDDGIGMEPDHLDGIFEVFQRLHTREEFDGTGIGLSVCRKIVDRHGGDIRVESSLGTGSTFFVSLPEDGEIHE